MHVEQIIANHCCLSRCNASGGGMCGHLLSLNVAVVSEIILFGKGLYGVCMHSLSETG